MTLQERFNTTKFAVKLSETVVKYYQQTCWDVANAGLIRISDFYLS